MDNKSNYISAAYIGASKQHQADHTSQATNYFFLTKIDVSSEKYNIASNAVHAAVRSRRDDSSTCIDVIHAMGGGR